ncbi:MCE family protein [Mycobacterium koreense]|uniref:Mammalian cell entry protein n=1 Tax=Mycolicibacillus koreensis TaxID=1069220 RepID=A0A7I7SIA8_9MYCO|nr:MlaD family protein [Mycolicibacillus koreensis]MCV7248712.1 MCE family protein [Mycolicibacillus koreensis]OSC33399.1 mammalian cell entry protein [Mycolicibacillus koreensis]BBY55676.1 putative Mce family protein [Mycolicibacillus koreensis]
MIDTLSRGVVSVVRAGHRKKTWLSGLALGLTFVVAVAYLLVGALRVNPFKSTYHVTVELADSGGLLDNQDVAVRGVPVGRVESIALTPVGVNALVNIESGVKIPLNSPVRVSGLSPAGEQYIDFIPDTTEGPFLKNGDVVGKEQTETPEPLYAMLTHADGLLAQVDPAKLEVIKAELSLTKEGPQKLTDIIDGGSFLLSTLNGVLPETVSLLKSSRVTLELLADKNAGLAATSANLSNVLDGVNKMDGGYRTLVDRGPALLSAVDGLFDDNSDTMVGLLANLTTTSRLLYVRTPAINALFPDYRGSTLEALGSAMHDKGLWATADIYPRYACDYGTPRRPGTAADYPEPFLYGYCADTDPELLIRGAKNAPRPAGDDTAGAPPGADLTKTADPTPRGRFSIPTPYGGPTLPIEPPS